MDLFGKTDIKQRYYPYSLWEDFKLGMYNPIKRHESEHDYKQLSIQLLSSPTKLKIEMTNVINDWIVATDHVLSNISCNRRAWLGQSACFYKHRVPEHITRSIWFELSESDQDAANAIADEVIYIYESEYNQRNAKEILESKRI